MYCKNCKQLFNDIEKIHDTRTNNKIQINCPFCMNINVVNATYFIEQYEANKPNQHSNKKLYHILKDAMLEKGLYRGNDNIDINGKVK